MKDKPSLDQLGTTYNTDKCSLKHNYLKYYEIFLKPYREKEIVLIELGVGPPNNMGKSLLTWKDYFGKSKKIIGVDIRHDTELLRDGIIEIEIGDCGSPSFLMTLAKKYTPDVIIDDASHIWTHQIAAFELLWPSLKSGGCYICEDLNTSFVPLSESGYRDCRTNPAQYFSEMSFAVLSQNRDVNNDFTPNLSIFQQMYLKEIAGIFYIKDAVVLLKK